MTRWNGVSNAQDADDPLPEAVRAVLRSALRDAARASSRSAVCADGDAAMRASRTAIMDAVRREPLPERVQGMRALIRRGITLRALAPSRWRRRGVLAGVPGMLASTVLALVLSVRVGDEMVRRSAVPEAVFVGDSVRPAATVTATHWLDTLRIVELTWALRTPDTGAMRLADGGRLSWMPPVRAVAALFSMRDRARDGVSPTAAAAGDAPSRRRVWRARVLVPRGTAVLSLTAHGAPLPAVALPADARGAAQPATLAPAVTVDSALP